MPAIHKQKSKLHASLTHSDQASSHGGQLLVEAVCRRFDLWRKLDQIESLDTRVRKTSGFAPSALVAQLLFNLTSGGCSLADAERLGRDRVLMELVGLAKWTEKLDKLAAELPETEWSPVTLAAPQETPLPIEQYAWLRHLPGECARAHVFAVVRRKEPGELFYRYG